jgi:hypothetical protein
LAKLSERLKGIVRGDALEQGDERKARRWLKRRAAT